MLLPEEALPEYEAKIDHARLIQAVPRKCSNWANRSTDKTVSCHGSPLVPGSVQCPQVLEGHFSTERSLHHVPNPYPWLANDGSVGDAQAPGKIRSIHYIRQSYLKTKPFPVCSGNQRISNGFQAGTSARHLKKEALEEMIMETSWWALSRLRMLRNKTSWHVGPTNNLAYKGIAVRLTKEPVVYPKETYGLLLNTILYGSRAYGRAQDSSTGRNQFDGQHVIRPELLVPPYWNLRWSGLGKSTNREIWWSKNHRIDETAMVPYLNV